MKVRMLVARTGTHNGVPYPEYGAVGEVDDDHAAQLIAKGLAEKPSVGSVGPQEETEAKETHDDVHESQVEERPAPDVAETRPAITRARSKTSKPKR